MIGEKMKEIKKKNNKKVITIILISIVILVLVGVCIWLLFRTPNKDTFIHMENYYIEKQESSEKLVNESKKIKELKTFSGLEFKEMKINCVNGLSVLEGEITNKTGKDIIDFYNFYFLLLDRNGNEIAVVKGVTAYIKNDETKPFLSQTLEDVVNAYDYKVISVEEFEKRNEK